ncbi:UDP-N-acetylmuramate--L-alanine ligase [Neochlamydia sp. AcF95]|uniref:UDP-N-acetylmuramate--L-alanine ligase n=1 Tax=Neochlamydia sp. AcF95 TaxID=2795734 RepID=UPI001BC9093C|nr:UDP-N-acetylmuramate--L-alanine ligase [Neochlamydia sp. AcF95]MBS4169964.1 Bifunctional enzyme MurC/Ddl [Neochlamydia sp. AcF95]
MISKVKHFHFIGIGGIGMSGLARILLNKKMVVTGSDMQANYVTEELSKNGAKIFIGHAAHQVPAHAAVIYSSDIKADNPEYYAALQQGCLMLHRSDLLLYLMQEQKTLTVAGTHGKTTTSALLAWIVMQAGLDPSYAVGGMLSSFNSNAGHGEGEYFIAEADESDGTFLKYHSYGGIITNIDADHLNYFGKIENLIKAFSQFLSKVETSEHLFWCGDDKHLLALKPKGVSYGFGSHCELQVSNFSQKGWNISFDVDFKGCHYSSIQLPMVGRHNALNAAAVLGLALSLGIAENRIRAAFLSFGGIKRRCEKKGEKHHILMLDDYAHHPTEIKATLEGIRQAAEGRRLIAVFQPHRYTRTQDCLGLYKDVFDEADEIFITEIYAAGEAPIEGVSSIEIIKEIEAKGIKKIHAVQRHDLASLLFDFVHPHDIVVSMGAGDITKLSHELLELLRQRASRKLKVGIVFGGRSVEHEVTFLSASHICKYVSPELYEIKYFGITKQGQWLAEDNNMQALKERMQELAAVKTTSCIEVSVFNQLMECDLFVPILHGPYGEDGTIQGFFEILDKAYIGPDHVYAAIAMDKAHTKYLMQAHQIATLPFVEISYKKWRTDSTSMIQSIQNKLNFPLFIKPVHLGSTIGVQKVTHADRLYSAIQEAFQFDFKLIVEEGLTNFREIEFAVLGNEEAEVFPPGEVFSQGNVYDFEAKYGANSMKAIPQASLSPEKNREGVELALAAYQAVGGTGMARVDFFHDADEKFWLNEINPIPGFTSLSLYPMICQLNGVDGEELFNRLIILALERKRRDAILCRQR